MKLLSHDLLKELAANAGTSPRGRAHFNIHASAADPVQRFIVCANRNSYFRPHRHLTRSELALILRGTFDVLIFDDRGVLTARHAVGEGTPCFGYETPRATWHTLVARTDGATFLEVKEGPFDPATAAEFATWAPDEKHPEAAAFLRRLADAQPGEPFERSA